MSHDIPSGPIVLTSPPSAKDATAVGPRPTTTEQPRPILETETGDPAAIAGDAQQQERPAALTQLLSHLAHVFIGAPVAVWAAIDGSLAILSVKVGHTFSPFYYGPHNLIYYSVDQMAVVHAIGLFLASYAFGLYGRAAFNSTYRILALSFAANLVALASTTLFQSWFRFVQVPRWVLLYSFLLTLLTTSLVRIVAKGLVGRTKVRVLLVGDPTKHAYLAEAMTRKYGDLYELPRSLDVRNLSPTERIGRTLEMFFSSRANEIVVEDDSELLLDLLRASAPITQSGGVLRTMSAFHEELLQEVPIDIADCRSLLGPGWGVGRQSTEIIKRCFDLLLGSIGLILAAPLSVLIAAAIKLTSAGPVIYKQKRVGRFGAAFFIYKFRTMHVDAEKDGAVWAAADDRRVSAVGRILRRSRLDELPQLWNILRGSMSFVGPRPERPEFVEALEKEIPYYQLRHLVPPGLTGWAQIRRPYGSSIEDARQKLCYDLYYVRRYGLVFDITVCVKTLFTMARGAR
ncbi:MAG TPA: exopolysaccharide biosynthesis polyprenyl glycosylphosphotransferase [Thermoanaerobaculia bacterium]|nr:exopolysaccharide biosynthesis polyprenyl glycosylphosphotransferase [Thermoanaerobaculia bacterium]